MNTQTNLHVPVQEKKPTTKVSDVSNVILREIFGTNEDFRIGVIKDITPAIAENLLKRNLINRNLRDGHVDWLANQMRLGYWKFTGDSIKLNCDGILVDKQHTLHAIVKSGTTQRFVVIGGLDDKIIEVIDTGISRTAGDVLKMNSIQNANTLAGVCRRILNFKSRGQISSFARSVKGVKVGIATTQKGFISNARILEEVSSNSRYSDAAQNSLKFYEASRMLSPSQYGLLYFLFSEKDPDSAWEFLSKFSNGVGLASDSPIYVLRQRLERERETKVKFSDSLKMYWFFTCWNKFRRGETLKQLTTPVKVEIPELL